MKSGWTGGQYSLLRALFGLYLFIHFVELVPWGTELFSDRGVLPAATASPLLHAFPNVLALWDTPGVVKGLLGASVVLSVLFAIGWYDRAAALALWYLWACLLGRNPLIANPGLPYVGWMLLAHAALPRAPYGAWSSRGRPDPGAHWRMPDAIWTVAWILMALGYTYSGYTKLASPSWVDGTAIAWVLDNPLARPGPLRVALLNLPDPILKGLTWGALSFELSFAPLAMFARLRPWLWSLMLAMHLSLMALIDFADLSLGMVMLHVFTFNPAWLPPRKTPQPGTVFYDGHCGLCHRTVRFILAEDRDGDLFRFAPLHGDAFRKTISEAERQDLPDSVVVRTHDGALLTRSQAILYVLKSLGGFWRVLGILGGLIPQRVRDGCYNRIARLRYRLFRPPTVACPMVPPHLRARFDH
jgi:predicted DCC family thiol-disulfide oxidoreductase YuxK